MFLPPVYQVIVQKFQGNFLNWFVFFLSNFSKTYLDFRLSSQNALILKSH